MADLTENPYEAPQAPVREVSKRRRKSTELASRGMRLVAYVLDALIGMVAAAPMIVGLLLDWGDQGPFLIAGVVLTLFTVIATFVYQLVLLSQNGWTLGKKICGIRIVRTNGVRAGLGRIFWLRMVLVGVIGAGLGLVPLVIPIFPENLGSWFSLADALLIFGPARRCIHDYIADTIVVKA